MRRKTYLLESIICLLFTISLGGWWQNYSKTKILEEKIALDKKFIERQSNIIMYKDSIILSKL